MDFAVSELQGGDQGGKCSGGLLGVENFQSQVGLEVLIDVGSMNCKVVAGMNYKFQLTCRPVEGRSEVCEVVVFSVSWANIRTVQWDNTSCSVQ